MVVVAHAEAPLAGNWTNLRGVFEFDDTPAAAPKTSIPDVELFAEAALFGASVQLTGLRAEGAAEADEWRALGWHGALLVMRDEFPVYLTEFGGLLAQSPPAYAPLVDLLIRHEVAFIDFATAELAGQADSMAVLDTYLSQARAA